MSSKRTYITNIGTYLNILVVGQMENQYNATKFTMQYWYAYNNNNNNLNQIEHIDHTLAISFDP